MSETHSPGADLRIILKGNEINIMECCGLDWSVTNLCNTNKCTTLYLFVLSFIAPTYCGVISSHFQGAGTKVSKNSNKTCHNRRTYVVINAQQARNIHHNANTSEKLFKTNAAIWFHHQVCMRTVTRFIAVSL
jgi:hypothetical protein